MPTKIEGGIPLETSYQISMNDTTRVECGLVKPRLLVPDPATMKERQTITDVDDCLQNDLIGDMDQLSAIGALQLVKIAATAVLHAHVGHAQTLVVCGFEDFENVGVWTCRKKHVGFSWVRSIAWD